MLPPLTLIRKLLFIPRQLVLLDRNISHVVEGWASRIFAPGLPHAEARQWLGLDGGYFALHELCTMACKHVDYNEVDA